MTSSIPESQGQSSPAAERKRDWPFPAYPNGWFVVAWSDEVATGEVVPLEYFGRDYVLYEHSHHH